MSLDDEAGRKITGNVLAASACAHFGKMLRRYLLRRLRNGEVARDIEQEVYLRLLRIADATMVRDPKAYMYRIASNVVYEHLQREFKQGIVFDSEAVLDWDDHALEAGDPLAEQLDKERRLKAALARVPLRARSAYIMHTRDGMTYPEIAAELSVS